MTETNPNARLETFCDGVFAIALTLLILDIKIPPSEKINTTMDFWLALRDIVPSVFAFILSFFVILITWVNHHNSLKLVNNSSGSFIYANGFLLLTVVFLPFPTGLMGEYILTDHAAPAVILYSSLMAIQAIAWILMCRTALKNQLGKNENSVLALRSNMRYGFFAFITYTLLAVIAFQFPLAIAILTFVIWIFWLVYGINIKEK